METFYIKVRLENERVWGNRVSHPPLEPLDTWYSSQWLRPIVERFLDRVEFPDEAIYQKLSKIGEQYLLKHYYSIQLPKMEIGTLCEWNEQQIFMYTNIIGNYFFPRSELICWSGIFGFLRLVKLVTVDPYCCEDGPFHCAMVLSHTVVDYIKYRFARWIEYHGGWNRAVRNCCDFTKPNDQSDIASAEYNNLNIPVNEKGTLNPMETEDGQESLGVTETEERSNGQEERVTETEEDEREQRVKDKVFLNFKRQISLKDQIGSESPDNGSVKHRSSFITLDGNSTMDDSASLLFQEVERIYPDIYKQILLEIQPHSIKSVIRVLSYHLERSVPDHSVFNHRHEAKPKFLLRFVRTARKNFPYPGCLFRLTCIDTDGFCYNIRGLNVDYLGSLVYGKNVIEADILDTVNPPDILSEKKFEILFREEILQPPSSEWQNSYIS